MKKKLLLLFTFGFLLSCSQEDNNLYESSSIEKETFLVSSDIAKSVALSFLGKSNEKKTMGKSTKDVPVPGFENRSIEKIIVIPDENDNPALYLVTFLPKGYIIVSATIKETPILGYSLEAKFDINNIPIGLSNWLVNRIDRIQIMNYTKDMIIPSNVHDEWARYIPIEGGGNPTYPAGSETIEVRPLLNTHWGQGQGYNNLSPELNCSGQLKKAPTGCVATAIAQVMRYHKFPSTYNWAIMPNEIYTWNSDTPGANQIAKLMKDIGTYVGMDYKCTESGASTDNIAETLTKKFGYSPSVKLIDYNQDILALELQNKRPVIISAYHSEKTSGSWIFKQTYYTDGHVWVCDGYKEILYKDVHNHGTKYEQIVTTSGGKFFHMNWGWNGEGMTSENNDGWFKYNDFEIKTIKNSNNQNLNYKYKQKMIVGIKL